MFLLTFCTVLISTAADCCSLEAVESSSSFCGGGHAGGLGFGMLEWLLVPIVDHLSLKNWHEGNGRLT